MFLQGSKGSNTTPIYLFQLEKTAGALNFKLKKKKSATIFVGDSPKGIPDAGHLGIPLLGFPPLGDSLFKPNPLKSLFPLGIPLTREFLSTSHLVNSVFTDPQWLPFVRGRGDRIK